MDRTTVKQAETEKTKRDVGGAAVGTHPRRGRSWEREGKGSPAEAGEHRLGRTPAPAELWTMPGMLAPGGSSQDCKGPLLLSVLGVMEAVLSCL